MRAVLVSGLGRQLSSCSADVVSVEGEGHAVAACPSAYDVSPPVLTSDVA